MNDDKRCSRCGQQKSSALFDRDRSRADGFSNRCKDCKAAARGTLTKRNDRAALATTGMRRCTHCGVAKALADFKLQKRGVEWHPTSWCRACANAKSLECVSRLYHSPERVAERATRREERLKNKKPPLTPSERRKKYFEKDPERVRAYWRAYSKTPKGLLHHRLQQSKRRAVVRSVLTAFTVAEWKAIVAFWDSRCAYCGLEKKLTLDHVVPIMRGGPHVAANIVPACKSCNSRKNSQPAPRSRRFQRKLLAHRERFS